MAVFSIFDLIFTPGDGNDRFRMFTDSVLHFRNSEAVLSVFHKFKSRVAARIPILTSVFAVFNYFNLIYTL